MGNRLGLPCNAMVFDEKIKKIITIYFFFLLFFLKINQNFNQKVTRNRLLEISESGSIPPFSVIIKIYLCKTIFIEVFI